MRGCHQINTRRLHARDQARSPAAVTSARVGLAGLFCQTVNLDSEHSAFSEDLSAGKPHLIIGRYAANCISLGTSRLLKSSSNCRDTDPNRLAAAVDHRRQLEPSRFVAEAARVFASIFRLILLNGPSLSQQSHRSPLTRAAKQQRISQGRTLNDLTRPLVVPRKPRADREVCTALNQ